MAISELYIHIFFGISLAVVATLITWAMLKFVRILDHPNHRSSHDDAIPKSGGISIVITFLIGMGFIIFFGETELIQQRYIEGFIFSAVLIAVISFVDTVFSAASHYRRIRRIRIE